VAQAPALLMAAAGAQHLTIWVAFTFGAHGCEDRTLRMPCLACAFKRMPLHATGHWTPIVRRRAAASTLETGALVARTGAVAARAPGQMATICWSVHGLQAPTLQAQDVRTARCETLGARARAGGRWRRGRPGRAQGRPCPGRRAGQLPGPAPAHGRQDHQPRPHRP
jgi:hypothetical protein